MGFYTPFTGHGDGGPGDIIAIILLSIITIGMVPDGIIGTAAIHNTGITFIDIMVMANVGIMVIEAMMLGPGRAGADIMAATCATTVIGDGITAVMCDETVVADTVVMAATCGVMAVVDMVVMAVTCGETVVAADGMPVIMCVVVVLIVVVI